MANKREQEKRKWEYGDENAVVTAGNDSGWTPTTFKLPQGMAFFKFKQDKTYRINVVPYPVGEYNDLERRKGRLYSHLNYYIHADIGPESNKYVCPKMFFPKGDPKARCPVCEEFQRKRRDNYDLAKLLREKKRQLWLFVDLDEKDKGIQVFETSYYGKGSGFGEMIYNKLEASDEDDPIRRYWRLGTEGMTLKIRSKKDNYNGKDFFRASNIEFVPRKAVDGVTDEMVEAAPCLDELLIHTPYADLNRILNQIEGEDDDAGETPAKASSRVTAVTRPGAKAPPPPADDEEQPDDEEVEADTEQADDEEVEADTEQADDDSLELDEGDTVKFMYKNKVITGEVTDIDVDKNLVSVKDETTGKVHHVDPEDITKVDPEEQADADEEEVEEQTDEADDEGDDLTADDDGFAFDSGDDEEEEEEEEAPPPPPKKPAPAAKPAPKPTPKAGPAQPPAAKPAPKPTPGKPQPRR